MSTPEIISQGITLTAFVIAMIGICAEVDKNAGNAPNIDLDEVETQRRPTRASKPIKRHTPRCQRRFPRSKP